MATLHCWLVCIQILPCLHSLASAIRMSIHICDSAHMLLDFYQLLKMPLFQWGLQCLVSVALCVYLLADLLPVTPVSIYFLIFPPFYFSLSFIGFTYFLLLSIPSLSTRIVPLCFQAGGRTRRPNLGLVCFVVLFLPRCMECKHGLATRILLVRPSVRRSNVWFVTKQKNDVSRFLYLTKDHLA